MEITFSEWDPTNRKRPSRACDSCKIRKKRCVHNNETPKSPKSANPRPSGLSGVSHGKLFENRNVKSAPENQQSLGSPSYTGAQASSVLPESERATDSHATTLGGRPEVSASQIQPINRNSRPIPERFVGDLNPEAAFLEQVSTRSASQQRYTRDDIGIWVEQSNWNAAGKQKRLRSSTSSRSTLLDAPNESSLIEIYFSRINSILPILDEAEFRQGYHNKVASSILVEAICLVAAKDKRAASFLRLRQDRATLMKPREFSKAIHASIHESLKNNVDCDRITLIRILVLMSLHAEGLDGAEEASMFLTQAIHHVHTLGLHLGKTGNPIDEVSLRKLFWCIWSLDRLNAATNGRPMIINDRDTSIAKYASGKPEDAAFEIWLSIADLLDKVTELYRPFRPLSVTGWEDEFPMFEEMVERHRGWHLSTSVLDTLHLFYLIIAILSSRSRAMKDIPRATPSHIRQSMSTQHIISLMNGTYEQDLHPLPVVPYGISLALSVSYKHVRQSQLLHLQEKSKQDFKTCFTILKELGNKWWSANIMAALAEKVLVEMEKLSSVAKFRVQPNQTALATSRPAEGVESGPTFPSTPMRWSQTGRDNMDHVELLGSQVRGQQRNSEQLLPPLIQPEVQIDNRSSSQAGFYDSNENGTSWNFDGMDDIFGAYMNPYFPLNFEDLLVENSGQIDWNDA